MTDINITSNTAPNGLNLEGDDSGNVNINNFVFENNNNQDIDIDGEILLSFNYFINFKIYIFNIYNNDGDYLFKGILDGKIAFYKCNIDLNDIDKGIIHFNGDGNGDFTFYQSNITRNRNNQNKKYNEINHYN